MKLLGTVLVAGSVVAFAGVAQAQRVMGGGTEMRGVELGGAVGYGDYLSHSQTTTTTLTNSSGTTTVTTTERPDNYSGGLGTKFFVGYRITPLFSLGGRFSYQFIGSPPSTISCGGNCETDYSAHAYAFGGYVRFYLGDVLHLTRLDPFAGIGLDVYARDERSATRIDHRTGVTTETTVSSSYINVPVTLGLEYYVTDKLAIGGNVEVTPWFYTGSDDCTVIGPTRTCTSLNRVYAFIGFSLRYTIGR